ncbi:MAG: FHA domain-containing protein [Myxococcota bacterium]
MPWGSTFCGVCGARVSSEPATDRGGSTNAIPTDAAGEDLDGPTTETPMPAGSMLEARLPEHHDFAGPLSPEPSRTARIQSFSKLASEPIDAPQEVLLGRSASNNIQVDRPDVSTHHARVFVDEHQRLAIEDLGSTNGTYVNGVRVSVATISFTDDVRIATAPIRLSDPQVAGMLVCVRTVPGPKQPITLGSHSSCDVQIAYPDVAPMHASVTPQADGAMLVCDAQSGKPTCIDTPQNRIVEAKVAPSSILLLSSFPLPLSLLERLIEHAAGTAPSRSSIALKDALQHLRPDATQFIVGREQGADVALAHPTISARHALFRRGPEGSHRIEDLGSSNGTFLNGVRIRAGIARPGDVITLGAVDLTIGKEGIENVARSSVRIDLVDVSVQVQDHTTGNPKTLVDEVSMSIFPSELVGMLGPSGAGKTTLLMTLLGRCLPSAGGVRLNGQPLFTQYEAFRTNVGYVPQDDIVHPELTVREALWYASRLRLPSGTSRTLIEQNIEDTLRQVGLWDQRDLQIGSPEMKILSGGQRRRVNLAVELVTDPALLILDEPTSGLSWSDAADVIQTLRQLADDGRTVCLTIHQPDYQEYEQFDNVAILGCGGKLLFFGPPSPDSYEFFQAEPGKPRQVLDRVEQNNAETWRARFRGSEIFQRFVVQRAPDGNEGPHAPLPKPRKRSSLHQFPLLLSRNLKLMLRNRSALALLILQAPLLGALIGFSVRDSASFQAPLYGCSDAQGQQDPCAMEHAFLACDPEIRMAALAGMDMSAQDTVRVEDPRTGLIAILMAIFLPMVIAASNLPVGERMIYERERLAGLRIAPYVLARFSILVGLGALVAFGNMAISVPVLQLKGGFGWYWIVGALTATAASAVGIALSAAVRTPTSALWGINLLVIPQLLFAGSIVKLAGPIAWLSALTTTRYGLEALTHIDLRSQTALKRCQVERYMENLPGFAPDLTEPIAYAAWGTGGITLVCLTLTMAMLFWKDRSFLNDAIRKRARSL